MTDTHKTPTVLIVLDGWGYREDNRDNAIANGNTPVWDRLWDSAPHTLISGSGLDVGLPAGQMGNSEVGHMSLGAGRVIYQNITRIDQAIAECKEKGIHGKATTPFLLARVAEITGGDSLASNIQLVYNNAKVAAQTAKAYCSMD